MACLPSSSPLKIWSLKADKHKKIKLSIIYDTELFNNFIDDMMVTTFLALF